MKVKDLEAMIAQQETGINVGEVETAMPALLRKVYVWMTLALVITGITAYGVASSPNLLAAFFSSRATMWILLIAELGLVFYLSARIMRMSLTSATLCFIIYSILNGVVLSTLFVAFTQTSIAQAFFVSAGTFAAMSAYGYFTKRSLDSMGKYLMMALVGLIIAMLVNIFVGSGTLNLIVSCVGVLLFTLLTAYDTQKIKLMLALQPDASEASQKIALLGSLTLYLDFINLFLYLVQLFGSSDN